MDYYIGQHNGYLLTHAHKRMARLRDAGNMRHKGMARLRHAGDMRLPAERAKACHSIRVRGNLYPGFDQTFDWREIIEWFDQQQILVFTWSSFTGEWKREFVLTRALNDSDLVAFRLRFS